MNLTTIRLSKSTGSESKMIEVVGKEDKDFIEVAGMKTLRTLSHVLKETNRL
jgi:hypothetical protein